MDITGYTSFISGVTANISNKLEPKSISAKTVGDYFISLAGISKNIADNVYSKTEVDTKISLIPTGGTVQEVNTDGVIVRTTASYSASTGTNQSQDGYWRYNTGVFTATSGYKSRLYDVQGNTNYYVSGNIQGTVAALVSYFDSGSTFLGSAYVGASSATTYTRQLITTPSGATKLGVTSNTNYGSLETRIQPTLVQEQNTDGKIARLQKSLYVAVTADAIRTDGFYRANNGSFTTTLGARNAYMFLLVAGRNYYGTAKITGGATALAVYFDSNNTFISSEYVGPTNSITYTRQLLTPPSNAAKVAICADGTIPVLEYGDYDSLALQGGVSKTISDLNNEISALKSKALNKNWGIAGDSISLPLSTRWSNYIINNLSPANVHNVAVGQSRWSKSTVTVSGQTISTQNYDNPSFAGISSAGEPDTTSDPVEAQKRANNCAVVHTQQFIADVTAGTYPVPDVFVFAYGTNKDLVNGSVATAVSGKTIDRDNTFTMANAARWCIQAIQTAYPNCRVFVSLPIQSADADSKNPLLVNTKIPLLIGVANALSVPVIDCYNQSGISEKFEVVNSAGRDLGDGLHPNSTGGAKHGRCIARHVVFNFSI